MTLKNSPNNAICRWGGEEFVIVFTGLSEEEVYEISEEIRKNILKLKIDAGEKGIFSISASFGIAKYDKIYGDEFIKAIALADEALYYSKNTGRNKVTKYSSLKHK